MLKSLLRMLLRSPYFAKVHTKCGIIRALLLSHDYDLESANFIFWFVSPWMTHIDRIEVFRGRQLVSTMKLTGSVSLSPGDEFHYSFTSQYAENGRSTVHHLLPVCPQQQWASLN
jgi:hypothetical protein